jgi:hypothetical protein
VAGDSHRRPHVATQRTLPCQREFAREFVSQDRAAPATGATNSQSLESKAQRPEQNPERQRVTHTPCGRPISIPCPSAPNRLENKHRKGQHHASGRHSWLPCLAGSLCEASPIISHQFPHLHCPSGSAVVLRSMATQSPERARGPDCPSDCSRDAGSSNSPAARRGSWPRTSRRRSRPWVWVRPDKAVILICGLTGTIANTIIALLAGQQAPASRARGARRHASVDLLRAVRHGAGDRREGRGADRSAEGGAARGAVIFDVASAVALAAVVDAAPR